MAYTRHRGTRVSKAHAVMLHAYEVASGRVVVVNEGARTLAEQWKLFRKNMRLVGGRWVRRPGRPLTAYPTLSAPHIKYRREHHALDINDGLSDLVAAFYRRHGVPVAFNVRGEGWHMDVLDERKLKRAAAKFGQVDPTLKRGQTGPSVVRLKKLLYTKGLRNFSGAKSSNRYNPYFSKYTKAAVRRFQIANGLKGDGVVGASTWNELRD